MNSKYTKTTVGIFALLMLVGCGQWFVSGQGPDNSPGIEGVWRTAVTIRNCQTGQPLPIPSFPGILMFEQSGTMTGTSTAVSSVYGGWQREPGADQYSFRSLSFRYDSSGNLTGTRTITQNVEVKGDEMTTNGEYKDHDMNGNLVASGCSTATGTRF